MMKYGDLDVVNVLNDVLLGQAWQKSLNTYNMIFDRKIRMEFYVAAIHTLEINPQRTDLFTFKVI